MKLEDLANELLIDIFDYIDFIHLLQVFYNLNSRLNKLIFNHYRLYHINFRSISKREFNFICQKHFSSIFNKIISLKFSNDDETPNSFELFLSYNFNFNQFYHLQSLSFECIHSLRILNQILFQCQNLSYLTHLYILKCHFKEQEQFSYLIKNIWNLPKLQYCQIDHQFPYGLKFTNTTIISFSIENLSLENFTFDYDDLSNLFQCTPCLQHLNISIQSQSNCKQFLCINPSSVNSIKLSYRNSLDSMLNLFEKLPNLFRLIIQMKCIYLNGYEWKKIIENYFPKLKIFQFKMNFKLHHSSRIEEELDELLNSFRTSFWIEEHQWFIRCDGILSNMNHLGILYTLPYAFEEFLLTNKFWSKSTGLTENKYDYVNILTIMNIKNNFYKDSSWFIDNFSNISHLKIHLPLNNNIWLFIQSLNQKLVSLDIILIEGFSILPLQNLLHQSSYLTSLCFGNFNNLKIISQLICPSIYRLDFLKKNRYKRYFDTLQCSTLINSSLGRQCKILLIYVENRINILQLIQNMPNLQSLICQCKDDQYNNELIQWLYDHLSSTCLILRDKYQQSNIRLWIK